MADHEQPYDPYIPSGRGTPGPSAQHGENDRTAALQAVCDVFATGGLDHHIGIRANNYSCQQIDDTVNVMRQNIQRTEQRQGHVDELDDRTKRLNISAEQFQRGTNRVRKQLWWKNLRLLGWLFLGLLLIGLIAGLGSLTLKCIPGPRS